MYQLNIFPSSADVNILSVELGYDVIEGTEQIVSLQLRVDISEVYGKSKHTHFRTKYRPVNILLKFICYDVLN